MIEFKQLLIFKHIPSALLLLVLLTSNGFSENLDPKSGAAIQNEISGVIGNNLSATQFSPLDSHQVRLDSEDSINPEHIHYMIKYNLKCKALPDAEFTNPISHEVQKCSSIGVVDIADGPYTRGPFCSCVMGGEEKCRKVVEEMNERIQNFLGNWNGLDARSCYDCKAPNGTSCSVEDKQPQPGLCNPPTKDKW